MHLTFFELFLLIAQVLELFFILDREELEGSNELCVVELFQQISDLLQFQLVFSLTNYEKDILTRSLVMTSTTSLVIIFVIMKFIRDYLDSNVGILIFVFHLGISC